MGTRIDLEYLHEISDGDNEFLRDLLESFVNQTPAMVAELLALIKNEDWDAVAQRAHKLKPTFEYVGLISIRENMEYIEKTIKKNGDLSLIPGMVDNLEPVVDGAIKEIREILKTLK